MGIQRNAKVDRSPLWLTLTMSGVSSLVITLLILVCLYFLVDFSFFPKSSCIRTEAGVNFCVFVDQATAETYISIISSFYGTIVTVLTAMLGMVAALAFWTIRAQALRQSEEAIEHEVKRYFETDAGKGATRAAQKELQSESITEVLQRLENVELALEEAEMLPFKGKLHVTDEEAPE